MGEQAGHLGSLVLALALTQVRYCQVGWQARLGPDWGKGGDGPYDTLPEAR